MKEIRRVGAADDKEYCFQRNGLTALVMSFARVVFCTMTSLRTPALFRVDKKNNAISWDATTVIFGVNLAAQYFCQGMISRFQQGRDKSFFA